MTMMECIETYIDQAANRMPIFTDDIFNYVIKYIPDADKKVLNEYIARYAKRNPEFLRYRKGVYYKTILTPFGQAGISFAELVRRMYLTEGEDIIGYETGPSYMNKIGLTTQMPAYTYLATERARYHLADKERLYLIKPVVRVNKENYRYLQLLDLLVNRQAVKFEADNYRDILRAQIDKFGLNFETLVGYAKYYKSDIVYAKLAELAKEVSA